MCFSIDATAAESMAYVSRTASIVIRHWIRKLHKYI